MTWNYVLEISFNDLHYQRRANFNDTAAIIIVVHGNNTKKHFCRILHLRLGTYFEFWNLDLAWTFCRFEDIKVGFCICDDPWPINSWSVQHSQNNLPSVSYQSAVISLWLSRPFQIGRANFVLKASLIKVSSFVFSFGCQCLECKSGCGSWEPWAFVTWITWCLLCLILHWIPTEL